MNTNYSYHSIQIEVKSTTVKKLVKKYDCCTESYVSLEVNLVFQRTSKFENGKLHCSKEPNTKILTYCNTTHDCPCGMNVCHHLDLSMLEGNAICTPGAAKCSSTADCTKVGDRHGGGELMVTCKNNKTCEYSGAVVMA